MTDPILIAATELKDAIEDVSMWRDYLVGHLREDIGLGHDKIINDFIYRLGEGSSICFEGLKCFSSVVNDVIKFEESENKKYGGSL